MRIDGSPFGEATIHFRRLELPRSMDYFKYLFLNTSVRPVAPIDILLKMILLIIVITTQPNESNKSIFEHKHTLISG